MECNEFLTIGAKTEGKLVEKKSIFLSFAHPVATVEEAEQLARDYRKKYYDARHVCFAYVLQPDGSVMRAYDNGEPSGTAGRPILGVIRSAGLTNVIILVVRYFGGIKLGTSGLIAAYKTAAEEALATAAVERRIVEHTVTFTFEYLSMNDVMQLLKKHAVTILSSQMDTHCRYAVSVPQEKLAAVMEGLSKIDGVTVDA